MIKIMKISKLEMRMKTTTKANYQNIKIPYFLLMNCFLKIRRIWISKISKMKMKRMIIKILQIFLRKFKNIKRRKNSAKQKDSNKLELKNLKKI
jgi:hypothetical protein